MKRLLVCIAVSCAGCGAVTPIVPVITFPVNPLVAAIAPLDGQWVLSDVMGGRSCLVIQELRVSIFNTSCSTNPTGFAPRIIDAPLISRAGDTIVLTIVYNTETFSEKKYRTTFTGAMQIDTAFQGTRVDQRIDEAAQLLNEDQPIAAPATMSRL
jgi:hypothetical protein